MDKALKAHIEYLLCIKINTISPISGGDISKAFLLETESERFFCKINREADALKMFEAEKLGLEVISETNTIAVPKVLLCEPLEIGAFLLMEHIEPKRPSKKDFELLGHQLAALHKFSESDAFGLGTDNFIGSLPQSNKTRSSWTKFYVQERLLPQLQLARVGSLIQYSEIPSEERLFKTCENLFPEVKPSLLHGDLWGGNYLISKEGTPYLIDTAIYYGHHEVDIAMTRLFGGFDRAFYGAYQEHFPPVGGKKQRSDIYQLYFLLVHLNLFGSSYKFRVVTILERYF